MCQSSIPSARSPTVRSVSGFAALSRSAPSRLAALVGASLSLGGGGRRPLPADREAPATRAASQSRSSAQAGLASSSSPVSGRSQSPHLRSALRGLAHRRRHPHRFEFGHARRVARRPIIRSPGRQPPSWRRSLGHGSRRAPSFPLGLRTILYFTRAEAPSPTRVVVAVPTTTALVAPTTTAPARRSLARQNQNGVRQSRSAQQNRTVVQRNLGGTPGRRNRSAVRRSQGEIRGRQNLD
jgi:hypothetical protein